MDKPWDCLRKPAKNPPMHLGSWTADGGAVIRVRGLSGSNGKVDVAQLLISDQWLSSLGLRQLAEFCNDLADQLDGKE
jgi:hypothetical protein